MLKKTITYKDFDGNERSEDYYFHLSKTEAIELDFEYSGGLETYARYIVQAQNKKAIFDLMRTIVLRSYGEKSLDGRTFVKNSEITEAFTGTNAYDQLMFELISKENAATEFMTGVLPKAE